MEHKYQSIETRGFKTFEKASFKKFGRQPKILHNEACFMFLLNGAFQIRTPIKSVVLSKNEGMLSKCGDYFYEDTQKEEQNEMITAIGIYFHPELLKDIFQKSNIKWNERKYVAYKVNIDTLLENYKNSLLYYFSNPSLFDEEMQLLKIKELLLILSKTENAPTVQHLISSLFSPQDYNFKEVIENNMYATLSIPEMATLCGMSLTSFKRKFSELYQDSPADYIRKQKLERATQLLSSGNLRISDIVFDCGFESISSFNRAFKKQYKVSPTSFREKVFKN